MAFLSAATVPTIVLYFFAKLIIIDVDGPDYWLMVDLLNSHFRPQVICVEFNPRYVHGYALM